MDVQLVVVEKGKRRRAFTLTDELAVLGRAKGNAVRIPSADVSRQHCQLTQDGGLVYVVDLDSVNGTFLNGERVEGSQVVRPGDRLEVGPVAFIVEYELTAKAKKRLLQDEEADYEVIEGDEEVEENIEIEVEEVETDLEIEEEAAVEEEAGPPEDAELAAVAEEEVNLDFSFDDQKWEMPAEGELRNILTEMEEEEDSAPPKKKKKS